GTATGQFLRHRAGEDAGGVEGGRAVEGDRDVEAARAGGHHEGGQAQLVQQVAEGEGGAADGLEVVGGGVEVEDEAVGVVEAVGPAEPDVRRHGVEVGQPHE